MRARVPPAELDEFLEGFDFPVVTHLRDTQVYVYCARDGVFGVRPAALARRAGLGAVEAADALDRAARADEIATAGARRGGRPSRQRLPAYFFGASAGLAALGDGLVGGILRVGRRPSRSRVRGLRGGGGLGGGFLRRFGGLGGGVLGGSGGLSADAFAASAASLALSPHAVERDGQRQRRAARQCSVSSCVDLRTDVVDGGPQVRDPFGDVTKPASLTVTGKLRASARAGAPATPA